jgi:hypothetical protein
VREIEPKIEITWSNRAAINFHIPGISRGWAQWNTKLARGLECRFLGKKGQFNLAQLEGLGAHPQISDTRSNASVLQFTFQTHEHLSREKLKELLVDHLRGFREAFGATR